MSVKTVPSPLQIHGKAEATLTIVQVDNDGIVAVGNRPPWDGINAFSCVEDFLEFVKDGLF